MVSVIPLAYFGRPLNRIQITFILDRTIVPSIKVGCSFICSRITIFRTLNSVFVTFNPFGNFAPLNLVFAFSDFKNFLCRVIFSYSQVSI